MSDLGRRALMVGASFISVVCHLGGTEVLAQGGDPIRSVQEIVRAFFPELSDRRHQMLVFGSNPVDTLWTTSRFMQGFGLEVSETGRDFLIREGTEAGSALLFANCEFEAEGVLHAMHLRGRANHYSEHEALRQTIDRHKEWTDEEVTGALKERGAQFGFGTRDAFVKSLPEMSALATAVGGMPRIVNVAFTLRSKDFAGTTYAQVKWEVDFEIQSARSNSLPLTYTAAFEPFGGKLMSINRVRSRD